MAGILDGTSPSRMLCRIAMTVALPDIAELDHVPLDCLFEEHLGCVFSSDARTHQGVLGCNMISGVGF